MEKMKEIKITQNIYLDDLIDIILNECEVENILDCLDGDDIKEYMEDKGYSVVDEDDEEEDIESPLTRYQIEQIVRQRTNRYPDKATVKEVFSDIIDELW